MEISSENQGGVAVVTVRGRVDASNADALGEALTSAIDAGTANVVLQCGELTYMSSAGLRQLLGAMKKAQAASGELVLVNVVSDVERVLQISGFAKLLKLYPSLDGALESLA